MKRNPEVERRSPLEGYVAPARAGEGIERRLRNEYMVPFMIAYGVAIGVVVTVAYAWFLWWWDRGTMMWWLTGPAALGAAWAGWWFVKVKRALPRLRLGHTGEVAVGEVLDGLRERGYRVFHDVGSEGKGNIDHVVIGPSGIYVIETKTRSLPEHGATGAHGRSTIVTDGRRIRVGDGPWDEAPITQAYGVRKRVREWLASEGIGDVPVRGVVVYPGDWWIEGSSGREVWVLKPEALGKWIDVEERQVEPIEPDRLEMLWERFGGYARGLAEKERARA